MPRDEREPGSTFTHVGVLDFETVGGTEIERGTYNYAADARAVLLAVKLPGEATIVIETPDFSKPLAWADLPEAVRDFHAEVEAGRAIWAAHNSPFDRAIWNYATSDFPLMAPQHIIDTAVQAMAAGCPAGLEAACQTLRLGGKAEQGKALIELFCLPASTATPASHPAEWREFKDYAGQDVDAAWGLFEHTLQLPLAEWREFWAAEVVNEYGIGIDVPMVEAAARLTEIALERAAGELAELTALPGGGSAVTTIDQVKRMIDWLRDICDPTAVEMLVRRLEERDDDTGEVVKEGKWTLRKERVRLILAYLRAKPAPTANDLKAIRLLEIRTAKAQAKFASMVKTHFEGVLKGQYVFGGAAGTGRFSSRGVQIHNLIRDPLPFELQAIDAVTAGCSFDELAAIGDDRPVTRKLAQLVRPAFIAQPDKVFCWSDWSMIEARINPFLAASPEAEAVLDVFRACDADPTKPDLYTVTAAGMMGLNDPQGLFDRYRAEDAEASGIRQRGKVAVLALGFGGAVPALQSMGANYGLHLPDDDATATVAAWRRTNVWAPRFWGRHSDAESFGLWGAIHRAIASPERFIEIGRVAYAFLPSYLGGSLICRLPSGRFLTYRKLKYERVEEKDPDTGEVIDVTTQLRFGRGYGRVKFWPGMACENVVQATAACLLRGTIRRLVDGPWSNWLRVVGHTHDEIITELPLDRAEEGRAILHREMVRGFDWTAGLPLNADETTAYFYSKAKASCGL